MSEEELVEHLRYFLRALSRTPQSDVEKRQRIKGTIRKFTEILCFTSKYNDME